MREPEQQFSIRHAAAISSRPITFSAGEAEAIGVGECDAL
jgi:hypothetical protein